MLAMALEARGVGALIEPMMEIQYCDAAPDLAGVQAVLFTSANGVRALAHATAERGVRVLSVGDATAACARREGFADVASAGGDAADLVRLAAARIEPRNGRLLHIAGSAAAGDLAGALRAHGFEVDRSVLYQARPVPALSAPATRALSAGEIDFVLLFSPRTAAIFARLVVAAGIAPDLDGAAALSISATANRALDGLPWHERLVAERPDQRALLDLLDRLLAKRRPG